LWTSRIFRRLVSLIPKFLSRPCGSYCEGRDKSHRHVPVALLTSTIQAWP
jgi:hypothetical protein